jgi:hypothetical protein
MMRRRVQITIVVALLTTALSLLCVNFYFYHFYSAHVVDHFVPATGNIYQVGMNGRTVFLTRSQNYLMEGSWCGSLLAAGLAAYLSNRWKLGTPISII